MLLPNALSFPDSKKLMSSCKAASSLACQESTCLLQSDQISVIMNN